MVQIIIINNDIIRVDGVNKETKVVTLYFSNGRALSLFEGGKAFPKGTKPYEPFRDFVFPVEHGIIESPLLVSFLKLAGAVEGECLKFIKFKDDTYLCVEDIDIRPVSEILLWAQNTADAMHVLKQ